MFEYFMESICSECVNGEEGCTPEDSSTCPFWGECSNLAELCETAEELADRLKENVRKDYYGDRYEAFQAGNW